MEKKFAGLVCVTNTTQIKQMIQENVAKFL